MHADNAPSVYSYFKLPLTATAVVVKPVLRAVAMHVVWDQWRIQDFMAGQEPFPFPLFLPFSYLPFPFHPLLPFTVLLHPLPLPSIPFLSLPSSHPFLTFLIPFPSPEILLGGLGSAEAPPVGTWAELRPSTHFVGTLRIENAIDGINFGFWE